MARTQSELALAAPTVAPEDVATARKELSARLADLRRQPGFPSGGDEDVLAMSLATPHTACPNPYLAEWVESTTPTGQDDDYADPGPFAADVSVGKGNRFYKAHAFPTKVPHEAIMRFILHYTRPGDLVLDGFAGSGMTGLAAQACARPDAKVEHAMEAELGEVEWGARRAVVQDLSPSATFIAAGLNLPIDAAAFDRRSAELLEEFDAELGWMYETTDDDGQTRAIDYTVWSEVFTCPGCGGEVVFYDAAFNERTGRVAELLRCPHCGKDVVKKGSSRHPGAEPMERRMTTVRDLLGQSYTRVDLRPVRIHYRVAGRKKSRDLDEADLAVLERVANERACWFPSGPLPLGDMTHGTRLGPKGFTRVHHLWSDRALVALAWLWERISAERDPMLQASLRFWVEQAFWGLSWMNRYQPIQQGKLGGSQVNRQMTGVYYISSLVSECSPRYNLEGTEPTRGKRQSLVKTWGSSPVKPGQVAISTGSSSSVGLPDASVDYVFVDPPFGSNIPYGDLALVVESWHRVTTNFGEEAIIDDRRAKALPEYQALMESCFREFFRVLKPGRWMTVEFSNSSNVVWLAIQAALSVAGFVVADTRVFDKEQGSYRQVTAKNAVERDLIISAYKPGERLTERIDVLAGQPDSAWEFVSEHLRHLPVTPGSGAEGGVVRERMADRLWDRMVAFHVHHGLKIPVTTSEFNAGLAQRFPERDEMYFLSEQVETYERHRLTIKELVQQELFITGEASAVQWLRRFLKTKSRPQTFGEIQPEYFKELQALPEWEDIPDLSELLDQSFVTDEQGRWYVPDPRKAADLEKLRRAELVREFNGYLEGKGPLERFRSEAVRIGFDDAWERGAFATIVSVGERLPHEAFNDEPTLLYYLDSARQLVAG